MPRRNDTKYTIGNVIDGYEIIGLNGLAKDGHRLLDLRCIKCGCTYNKVRANGVSYLTQTCEHTNNNMAHWVSKRLRNIYNGMLHRCYNPNMKSYRHYGAKGIEICSEWKNNPQTFNDWAVQHGYSDCLSIDRIDSKKNYSPDNCRWISPKDNSKWKSTTSLITVKGITDSGRGWAKRLKLSINYINKYIREYGYDAGISFIEKRLSIIGD